jgi:phage head maturation protease
VTLASERSEIVRRSEFRASDGADGHTLEGYAAVFNAWTDIRDQMGSDNWLVEPVRDAIRDGGVTGMSFRFRVVSDNWNDEQTERTINEVELLELGPVVFPAYDQTSVAVRSLVGLLDDESRAELARELVDALSTVEHRDDEGVCEDATPSTSTVAVEPADEDDGPDEPPVASHDNRTRIADALARFRHHTERTTDGN